jgi:hypothetical protein
MSCRRTSFGLMLVRLGEKHSLLTPCCGPASRGFDPVQNTTKCRAIRSVSVQDLAGQRKAFRRGHRCDHYLQNNRTATPH